MSIQYPTIEHLNQCFEYLDGELIWKHRPREHFQDDWSWKVWTTRWAGKKAGCVTNIGRKGHVVKRHVIRLGGFNFYRNVLVWALIHGEFYDNLEIDHIDLNKLNDRIENLRVSTESQNRHHVGLRKDNRSGYKGVCLHKQSGKWMANFNKDKVRKYLGLFDTIEEAIEVRRGYAREQLGEFYSDE